VLDRARVGERVEVGCLGGHGRTGTALACLAILTGCPSGEAVAWVRANYCADAVETAEQESFVVGRAGVLGVGSARPTLIGARRNIPPVGEDTEGSQGRPKVRPRGKP
jgi:hypothetical protein